MLKGENKLIIIDTSILAALTQLEYFRNSNGTSITGVRSGEITTTTSSVAQTSHSYVTLTKMSLNPKMTSHQRKNARSLVRTVQLLTTSSIRVVSREKSARKKINNFIINNNNNSSNSLNKAQYYPTTCDCKHFRSWD